jgi:DNA-binding beta-propeller fold protein YncE
MMRRRRGKRRGPVRLRDNVKTVAAIGTNPQGVAFSADGARAYVTNATT